LEKVKMAGFHRGLVLDSGKSGRAGPHALGGVYGHGNAGHAIVGEFLESRQQSSRLRKPRGGWRIIATGCLNILGIKAAGNREQQTHRKKNEGR
jgi:hypothetical protein